jgi:hypothetical protein
MISIAVFRGAQRGFRRVKMMNLAVGFAAEDADCRMLSTLFIFNAKIHIESRRSTRQ